MPLADSRIGQSIQALDTPAVLVDLDVLERNIGRMAAFAAEQRIALRPHAKSRKTHWASPNANGQRARAASRSPNWTKPMRISRLVLTIC